MKALIILLGLTLCAGTAQGEAGTVTLDHYLGQVGSSQKAIEGARKSARAAALLRSVSELEISPKLFGDAGGTIDNSPQIDPSTQGDSSKKISLTAGASLKTRGGLEGKAYTSIGKTNITGLSEGDQNKWNASQNLELSASLWRNWKGRETDSSINSAQAAKDAQTETADFEKDTLLTQAEQAYWQLAAVRESMKITGENLNRAKTLREWSRKRSETGLADESEYLQAEAAVKTRERELLEETDLLEQASAKYNSFLGLDSADVPSALESVDGAVDKPAGGLRADIRAAALQARAAAFAAINSAEALKPSVDAYSRLSLNGLSGSAGMAAGGSFSSNGTAAALGLRLGFPLSQSLVRDSQKGYELEAEAADLKYRQVLLDSRSELSSLSRQFDITLKKLSLARELEKVQLEKYRAEQKRHEKGKTTVYFTITFQDDYAAAQISRLAAALKLRLICAQMKLYGRKGI